MSKTDTLETQRLLIRAFQPDDLPVIHRILDEGFGDGKLVHDPAALDERTSWLEWSRLSSEWYPKMYQTPYGDRAVVLKATGALIGSVGLVPVHSPFDQLPALRDTPEASGYFSTEVGLFWVIDQQQRGQGYATEAARSLIEFAFAQLQLRRIIATTEYSNLASQAVMRKLGMQVERNPLPTPPWLQVVGVLAQ